MLSSKIRRGAVSRAGLIVDVLLDVDVLVDVIVCPPAESAAKITAKTAPKRVGRRVHSSRNMSTAHARTHGANPQKNDHFRKVQALKPMFTRRINGV